MTTPQPPAAQQGRLVSISFRGRTRRFDTDGDGRLCFKHVAKVFKLNANLSTADDWTLDDTSLRLDDQGLTCSALRDLFPLPAGTAEQPLVLQTGDDATPPPSTSGRGTPGVRGASNQKGLAGRSPATRAQLPSPCTRAAAAAAAAAATAVNANASTPGPSTRGAAAPPGCRTPTALSPLRGARTPSALGLPLPAPTPGRAVGLGPRQQGALLDLSRPLPPDSELLRHPLGHGSFFFPASAASHLPMLMACHLPPPLQRLLRAFRLGAQCAITARAMALYAARTAAAGTDTGAGAGAGPGQLEYFADARLEVAITEARSYNPPQDRYCAYSQSVRLTGKKRKPAASPRPAPATPSAAGARATTPLSAARSAATAAASASATTIGGAAGPAPATTTHGTTAAADVDMDASPLGWAFVGGGTVHCPGGVACRRAGRHENWLLSDAADRHITFLPVLYDSEEHSAVLLPLAADARAGGPVGRAGDGGQEGAAAGVVWFKYAYESRGGRRGHNFWDWGLGEHLEQAVRDVAGEEALHAATGGIA